MLITPPPPKGAPASRQAPLPPTPYGVEVEVLVADIYNGPDHKSLGRQEIGAIISIASGGYSAYLIEHGFVRPAVPSDTDSDPTLADLVRAALVEAAQQKLQALAADTEVPNAGNPEPAPSEPAKPDANNPPTHEVITDPERPWLFWCTLGITEGVAKNLWDSGFISAARTMELGETSLLSVVGVGPVRAKQIIAWAEANG